MEGFPLISKTLGHYRILEKIGQGGMGEVFLAEDTSLHRKVALKFLPLSMQQDPTTHKRFLREARSAAALDHPYIRHINEVSESEGQDFIVMEYVEGPSLKDGLEHEPLPLRERLLGGASRIRSLAVLPLTNLSGDPGQEYFSDGMTDALITDLSKIGALNVISRTSAMQYKGAKKALREIAHELGVDGVIEDSVARSGGRIRITAQLIQAATDTNLWADSCERDLQDVFLLQGEVAQAITRQIMSNTVTTGTGPPPRPNSTVPSS